MPGPVNKALLGVRDVLRDLGKVHRGLSELEGAKKIPKEVTEAQRKMSPLQIIEDYNKRGAFGTTKKGEPIRAAVSADLMSESRRALDQGRIPRKASVQFYPESEFVDEITPSVSATPVGRVGMREALRPTLMENYPLTEEMVADLMHSPRRSSRPVNELPNIVEFDTSLAAPGSGSMQYQMLYDALKAQDDMNLALTLSPVNKMRRLGNVMQHGLRHGDYRSVVPITELGDRRGSSHSTQLFNRPVLPGTLEAEWMGQNLPRAHISELNALNPRDLIGYDFDDLTGLLALREASMAGAYGPLSPRSKSARPPVSDLRPIGRPAQLRQVAQDPLMEARRRDSMVTGDPEAQMTGYDIRTGIGPNVLGRQLTTEAVLDRLFRGQDWESILEDILKASPDPASFKGRYADGGEVVAY